MMKPTLMVVAVPVVPVIGMGMGMALRRVIVGFPRNAFLVVLHGVLSRFPVAAERFQTSASASAAPASAVSTSSAV